MEVQVEIRNEEGLHARPAGAFVKKAAEFKSLIEVHANGQIKSAKSLMGLMSLGLTKGAQFKIVAQGVDAADAVATLQKLVENKFDLAGHA